MATYKEEAVEAVLDLRHQGEAWKLPSQRREVEEGRIRAELLAAEPFIRKEVEDRLEKLAEEYEARLAKGEWSIFNTREQVAGWGQGVRAALQALASQEVEHRG